MFQRKLDSRTAARLASISRRSVGLPAHARAPRLTPATALLSLERMAQPVERAEVGA